MKKLLFLALVLGIGYFLYPHFFLPPRVQPAVPTSQAQFPINAQGSYISDDEATKRALGVPENKKLTQELRSQLAIQGFPSYIDILPTGLRDRFGKQVPTRVLSVRGNRVTFIVLTKRPGAAREYRLDLDKKGMWLSSDFPKGLTQRYTRR